jgi:triacylglycerol lipase
MNTRELKTKTLKTISIRTFATLLFIPAFSFGGGGGGDTGGDTGLPLPDTCTTNCGYETGANPNLDFLQASLGPQTFATTSVSSSVDGFGGGTVYYPTSLNEELATISIAPGFTNTRSAIEWWGPILASHGFVVITIDTNSRFDQPESRSRQLDSALSYLITQGNSANGPLSGLIDENRLATMGFSMGGGGALRSASRNRLSATVPLAPWNTGGNSFNEIEVPTMIMGCQNDGTAPVGSHARAFYNTIPANTDKAYLEISGGPHNCATGQATETRPLISTYGISWLKRFLDKDARYNQFLCGPNHTANNAISDYRETCNYL